MKRLIKLTSILFTAVMLFTNFGIVKATEATKSQVNLVAVGDNLLHSNVLKASRYNGRYNFNNLYKNVKPYIKAADLAVINQETILVDSNYSGYPAFGSPKCLADSIANAGFDIVTQATNHTMDRGAANVTGTLNYWNSKFPQIKVLGIHKSQQDANTVKIVKKNGIRIALLNYTYGLNGHSLPSGKGYLVDLLTSSRKSKIANDIQKAKKNSDFVIVFTHWGVEYQYNPSSSQKSWAQFFADQGVNLVIGAHPHVLQPYKMVTGKKGNKMLVYYSLGNFVSNQGAMDRILGGMAKVTIIKDAKGTRISAYSMDPLVTHISSGSKAYTTYRLQDYTDALAKQNYIKKRTGKIPTIKYMTSLYTRITGRTVK